MNEGFDIRQARWKTGLGVLGCVGFVTIGSVMIQRPDPGIPLIGWAGILFFGAMAPLWLAGFVAPARLRADPSGLSYRSAFREWRVAWREIAGLEAYGNGKSLNILVVLHAPVSQGGLVGRLRPKTGRRVALMTAWTMPPREMLERLNGLIRRFGAQGPSRSAGRVVM